jgi:hypothetical protein
MRLFRHIIRICMGRNRKLGKLPRVSLRGMKMKLWTWIIDPKWKNSRICSRSLYTKKKSTNFKGDCKNRNKGTKRTTWRSSKSCKTSKLITKMIKDLLHNYSTKTRNPTRTSSNPPQPFQKSNTKSTNSVKISNKHKASSNNRKLNAISIPNNWPK